MARNYLVKCRKCKWWFYSKNPNDRYHPKCNPKKKKILKRSRQFKIARFSICERDNYICQLCGVKGETIKANRIHVHHIDKNYKNNDINNLVTLCSMCHARVHKLENKDKFNKLSDFPLKPKRDFEVIPEPVP